MYHQKFLTIFAEEKILFDYEENISDFKDI